MDYEKKELLNQLHGPVNVPHVNEPYPPIKVMEANPRYARILLESYAGNVSEMTAINLYLYHHYDSDDELPEFADIVEAVAIVEMHHLEILAKLIILLGGDPRYHGSDGAWWSGRYVDYLTGEPCLQIHADIRAESAAITQYRQQIIAIDDPYVQAMLQRIIKDEQLHLAIFRKLLNKYCPKPSCKP
ncbi:MAG: hypothetical protein APF76_14710 [Desulfitibacter sp. BRH_c19]|nr:MAG: hypothetical protein APF76_14710 [Desulfitibacter sp. BRH_c19]